jgi:two-component system, chemotaxis family, CheB/CheR fusion protein
MPKASSSGNPDTEPQAEGLPPVAPDVIEQEHPEFLDNVVPTRGYKMLPMVGLGGSAGGIVALQEFFRAMPADTGMIFVVIMHLSPTHESTLADLLSHCTSMKVLQAVDGMKVFPNHVYVIPPGKDLTASDGHLRLNPLEVERGRRVVVDLFFRSLADTHGPHAAAIILSGADGDGALGIKRIKERGGLTIAQDLDEAQHPSMPRTAIETGMVDWVMRVADIPQRLVGYMEREKALKLPPEEGPQPAQASEPSQDQAEASLREVLLFLRTQTGRDFSYYKRATILRRIARRMQVNGVDDLPSYLSYLRMQPGESGALLQDLLISVTNFFRDRDAFHALEKLIPQLFEGKTQSDSVRVWVPACATGEEAYSIAMLLIEHARTLEAPPSIQVFACDLDDEAINKARSGLFPLAMIADVSEERVKKFFVREHAGYRVRRELRELVLFAVHDLLKDAPFSRMDLISCRNLLIYLNRPAQTRVFETLHFALKPGGLLFLGTSEAIEDGSALFRVVDKKNRIYAQQPTNRIGLPVAEGPNSLIRAIQALERGANHSALHGRRFEQPSLPPFPAAPGPLQLDRSALAEVHFKLLERLAPPSAIVNAEHEIVHLSESAGRFLKLSGGEPTSNLLRLVDPMVRAELRSALFRCGESNMPVTVIDLPVQLDGQPRLLDIRVSPATQIAQGFLLVIFEVREPGAKGAARQVPDPTQANEPIVQHLERELEQVKSQLRDTIEQYEASTEEMKASNEELQAMNEELRSATEELETSREELQSINEELVTVNVEMKGKVEELANANSDLQNLMASTSIATIFLDRELTIKRYTPKAVELFNLRPGDIGRPLHDLRQILEYPELISDAKQVLLTLVPVDRQVRDASHFYQARLQPYRTLEDHIAGVVLTCVDVTEEKEVSDARAADLATTTLLSQVAEQLIQEGDVASLLNTILDAGMSIMHADAGAIQLLDEEARVLRLLAHRGFPQHVVDHFAEVDASSGSPCGKALEERRRSVLDFEAGAPDPGESKRWHREEAGVLTGQSTPLIALNGRVLGMLSTHWKSRHRPGERELRFLDLLARQAADAIERKQSDELLREQMEELQRFNDAAVGREMRMIELKKEINELLARLGEPPRYSPPETEEKAPRA